MEGGGRREGRREGEGEGEGEEEGGERGKEGGRGGTRRRGRGGGRLFEREREQCTTLTLNCLPQIVSIPLSLNNVLINLSRGYVVVAVKSDVEETLVVPEVKVHFTTIIQYKHLTCMRRTWLLHANTNTRTTNKQDFLDNREHNVQEKMFACMEVYTMMRNNKHTKRCWCPTMLIWGEGSCINVQVRIDLDSGDLQPH